MIGRNPPWVAKQHRHSLLTGVRRTLTGIGLPVNQTSQTVRAERKSNAEDDPCYRSEHIRRNGIFRGQRHVQVGREGMNKVKSSENPE